MFDKLKAASAVAGLLKNQDKLKEAGARIRARMEATTVTGEAGQGAARVRVTGTMKVLDVELSPALVMGMAADDKTCALAGSLIAEAANNALTLAQARVHDAIQSEAREMGLADIVPDLSGMLGLSR